MEFLENELYHIYNRGNNQQPISLTMITIFIFYKKSENFFCRIAISWLIALCPIIFISLYPLTHELLF